MFIMFLSLFLPSLLEHDGLASIVSITQLKSHSLIVISANIPVQMVGKKLMQIQSLLQSRYFQFYFYPAGRPNK
jgi:hypothetical protein